MRWSHNGTYLASASDDQVVMVWTKQAYIPVFYPCYRLRHPDHPHTEARAARRSGRQKRTTRTGSLCNDSSATAQVLIALWYTITPDPLTIQSMGRRIGRCLERRRFVLGQRRHRRLCHRLERLQFRYSFTFCSLHLLADQYRTEIVARLAAHADFAKGVIWDPVGQFLATQV